MYTALIAAIIWTIASKGPAAAEMAKQPEGYDNGEPRQQMAKLEGRGRRAVAAHQNAWEALTIHGLAIAAFVASGQEAGTLALGLAWGWLALRIAYTLIYVAGLATLRTAAWSLALLCSLGLIALAGGLSLPS